MEIKVEQNKHISTLYHVAIDGDWIYGPRSKDQADAFAEGLRYGYAATVKPTHELCGHEFCTRAAEYEVIGRGKTSPSLTHLCLTHTQQRVADGDFGAISRVSLKGAK